ncbi:MAG: hypothetical protein C0443_04980 [Comamonadaceae bacterium]|nr:hypothetical protein [Comamonadaceae bacterium]
MKLHADTADAFAITAYGEGWVAVNGQQQTASLVLTAAGMQTWNCSRFEDLTPGHFEALLADPAQRPQLVLFGSGSRLRFARPALLQSLIALRIGVETMDTQAACRTYNILAGEGRRVTAALLIGD